MDIEPQARALAREDGKATATALAFVSFLSLHYRYNGFLVITLVLYLISHKYMNEEERWLRGASA